MVGCEYSNTISQAFRGRGHEVWSCDLEPSEGPKEWHLQVDIFEALDSCRGLDLIILNPPCTHMSVSGNRWYSGTDERATAIDWTVGLWNRARERAYRVVMENPVSVLWKHLGGVTQYIHPWEYGHEETKKTGLKLHNLPKLKPTNIVGPPPPTGSPDRKGWERVWRMPPSIDRPKERSRFLVGWGEAMAEQWGV